MFETHVSIYDSRGIYPKQTVLFRTHGYSFFKNIPLFLQVFNIESNVLCEELLHASFLITQRNFPAFSFYPLSIATIVIRTERKPSMSTILSKTKQILSGKTSIPILRNPYKRDYSNTQEALKTIKRIRSKPEYIDLFHCKKLSLRKQVKVWSRSYHFSSNKVSSVVVKRYFNAFQRSSRLIHIALYYFVNASRLIHEYFPEDGGLNLQLTVEAIIRDFMKYHSINNKLTAIQKLQNTIQLPNGHMQFLEELYDARNLFLAHIDEDMYTENQNIDDPDRYCYEHYESVSWLITTYIQYKENTEPGA